MQKFWEKTETVLQTVGDFQARLILTLLYGLFAIPVGLFLRFNSDPLNLTQNQQNKTTYWQPRPTEIATLQNTKRQG